jgi:hypothetical protein
VENVKREVEKMNANKLTGKDLINIGIYSAIYSRS